MTPKFFKALVSSPDDAKELDNAVLGFTLFALATSGIFFTALQNHWIELSCGFGDSVTYVTGEVPCNDYLEEIK